MSNVTMTSERTISLPLELCEKHGFRADVPIRIVETRTGLLLIPVSNLPMSEELAREVSDWQSLAMSTWDAFPYEDSAS